MLLVMSTQGVLEVSVSSNQSDWSVATNSLPTSLYTCTNFICLQQLVLMPTSVESVNCVYTYMYNVHQSCTMYISHVHLHCGYFGYFYYTKATLFCHLYMSVPLYRIIVSCQCFIVHTNSGIHMYVVVTLNACLS